MYLHANDPDGLLAVISRSKPLVAMCVPAVLAACMSTNDNTAHVNVAWTLELSASGSAVTTTCPTGDDTAALYSQLVDPTNNNAAIGDPIIALFECSAGSGSSVALAPGDYDEWVVIENHDATTTAAKSPTSLELNGAPLTLTVSDVNLDEYIVLDGGYFRYEPSLAGATSGSAVTCATADATTYVLTATDLMGSAAFMETAPCSNDMTQFVLTDPIPTGLYEISLVANTAAGSAVGPATTLDNEMIAAASVLTPVVELGPIVVEVNGM